MYVSTRCYCLSYLDCCDDEIDIALEVAGYQYKYRAELFRGGQRARLPDEATMLIVEALLQGEPVCLQAGIHRMTVTPACFGEVYQCLESACI